MLFNIVNPVACGIDVHKKSVTASIITLKSDGTADVKTKTFSTFTEELYKMKKWINDNGCSAVGMESTGVYWIPIFNVLEDSFEITLCNARYVKNVPGKKTDVKDSEWLAQLLAFGLLPKSFIPEKEIRQLRSLTRQKAKLIKQRSSEKRRVIKLLESSNIKLSSVASNCFGISGTEIIKNLVENKEEADPDVMSDFARGKLKKKKEDLKKALNGSVDEVTAKQIDLCLDLMSSYNKTIKSLQEEIDKLILPYNDKLELLDTIPGVGRDVAETLIAEIGPDVSVFPSADHLVSWAGLAPGNNISAGKKKVPQLGKVIKI